MKRILAFALALLPALALAQTTREQFASRYATLVKNVGVAGVGVETLLDKWEAAWPDDVDMMVGRFLYGYSKCQGSTIERKDVAKYLGEPPLMSLKDSLGNAVNYFEVTTYDDAMFGTSLKWLERAIQAEPYRLDFRLHRVSALVGYEKDSPDMATSDLKGLIDYNYTQKPVWEYPGIETIDNEVFTTAIQEYCVAFFKYATPASYEAFRQLSEKMLACNPGNPLFLDNLGSYWLVAAKDYKKALSYYNKVLKKHPDDMTAISNCIVLARTTRNVKLEKKYLPMLIKYSADETAVEAAKVRIEYLDNKKK